MYLFLYFNFIFLVVEAEIISESSVTDDRVLTDGREELDYTLPATSMEYLEKMRTLCQEKGAELVLIKSPTNSWAYWWHDEWEAQVVDYAEKNDLAYYNFIPLADEIGIDWSVDTYDSGMHLNVYGAEKLTDYFGRILSEEHGLRDMRSDIALSEAWAVRVEKYYEERNKTED